MGREVPLLCVKGMRGKEFASDYRKNKTTKKQIETYTVPRNKPAFEAATVNEQAGQQLYEVYRKFLWLGIRKASRRQGQSVVPGSVSTPPTSNFLLRFLPLAGRNQPRPSSGLQSFLHTGESAVEKRLTVTSCCDSKPPGSRQGVRERACPWVPCLPVRFGRVPGCVWARRAAHSWPGRRARRAPLRAAGCAGPERSELGEEPGPVAGALPVIGLLCCNFSRALRGACAHPAPLPRESLHFLGLPGGDQARLGGLSLSWGLFGSCVPGGR